MATEKQIAANRANAKRSTGPKTAAGRAKSSRNAYLHGLSCALRLAPSEPAKVDAIVAALVTDQANKERLDSAFEFARAQLELLRIRTARTELTATVQSGPKGLKALRRLLALDRYERLAHTKRRRASCKL